MEQNIDLKYIKYHYGENFAHLCRRLFPSLLEKSGDLTQIIKRNFNPSRELYYDIVNNSLIEDFKAFIFGCSKYIMTPIVKTDKSPEELMDEAGYVLYPECQSNEDILLYRHFYKREESLCTFREERLKSCRVWFAIKKDVDKIRREDFTNPERQDEYGTSVISIQFTKGKSNILSIKNRYNHAVDNPDATFGNNLDNIIPGLSYAFSKAYNLNIDFDRSNSLEIPNYVRAVDGKFYKFNSEYNGIYFCSNNIVIKDEEPVQFDNKQYVVFDNYILDMKDKLLFIPWQRNVNESQDAFTKSVGRIKEVRREWSKKEDTIFLIPYRGEKVEITISKSGQLKRYSNPNVTKIENDFLIENETLEELELENVKQIGSYCLIGNSGLKKLVLPNIKTIGDFFMEYNYGLKDVDLPNLERVGDCFLRDNNSIEKLNIPSLKKVGDCFLASNNVIKKLNMSNMVRVGSNFLERNNTLVELSMPNLESVNNNFMINNNKLLSLNFPKLKSVGYNFLNKNESLRILNAPNLNKINLYFLPRNQYIDWYNLPSLEFVGKERLSLDDKPRLALLYSNNLLKELHQLLNETQNSSISNKNLLNEGKISSVEEIKSKISRQKDEEQIK